MAAPLGFLLLLGVVVLGVVAMHQVQLNQAMKNSARAVAICGQVPAQDPYAVGTLPDGSTCTAANVQAYINAQVAGVASGLDNQDAVIVHGPDGTATPWTSSELGGACYPGQVVEVSISYQQPLYLPLIGYVLGNGSSDTRSLSANGEATC